MAKLNSIGVKAKDIDRIFADAIKRIAEGDDEFSCCAISKLDNIKRECWKVREFYTEVLEPGLPQRKPPFDLLSRVVDHVGLVDNNKSQGFRILMLSLVKAAWRDLV